MNRHFFKNPTPASLATLLLAIASAVGLSLAVVAAPDHDHYHDHADDEPAAKAVKDDHDHDDHGHGHEQPAATTGGPKAEPHDHNGDEREGHTDEVKLTPEAIQKHRIKVEPVKRQQLRPSFVVPARVSFNDEAMAHVGSAVKGRITDLKVKVGDEV